MCHCNEIVAWAEDRIKEIQNNQSDPDNTSIDYCVDSGSKSTYIDIINFIKSNCENIARLPGPTVRVSVKVIKEKKPTKWQKNKKRA